MSGTLIYYKCMTPEFLKPHVIGVGTSGSTETELNIAQDSQNNEIILRVDLFPAGKLAQNDDITVVMNVVTEGPDPIYPPPPVPPPVTPWRRPDPLAFMVSDGDKAVGIQVRDTDEYHSIGPYQGISGRVGGQLTHIKYLRGGVEPVTSYPRRWPQLFEIILKPQSTWGACSTAIEGGHSFSTAFPFPLRIDSGLKLEVYRHRLIETYTINMIEVAVYIN